MIPNELAEQLRSEVKRLKDAQDDFLQTYKRLCIDQGGPEWTRKGEKIFNRVRADIIPIMRQLSMDQESVQTLCSWAEHALFRT